jgi:hypothetical protein
MTFLNYFDDPTPLVVDTFFPFNPKNNTKSTFPSTQTRKNVIMSPAEVPRFLLSKVVRLSLMSGGVRGVKAIKLKFFRWPHTFDSSQTRQILFFLMFHVRSHQTIKVREELMRRVEWSVQVIVDKRTLSGFFSAAQCPFPPSSASRLSDCAEPSRLQIK